MNDHKVKGIIKSISNINSETFFNDICISLSRAIDADYVFIAMLDDEKAIATSIALAKKGDIVDNFSYALADTPCSEVSGGAVCTHSRNIQQLYPDDELLVSMNIEGYVGIPLRNINGNTNAILIALFEDKIAKSSEIESLFLLFSGLIERELHKASYLKKLTFSTDIIERTHEAIMVCDPKGSITFTNPSFTRLTGYSQEEALGENPKILSSGRHDDSFYRSMWGSVNNKGHWQGEIWNKRKDGSEYLQQLSITAILDENNQVSHYNAFFYNITEQHEAEQKIKYQNSFDTLTNLPNKNSLFQFIDQHLTDYYKPSFYRNHAALLAIDIDQFSKFNVLYGLSFGDEVLVHVAKILAGITADTDIMSRTSGDNFAMFANNIRDEVSVINIIKEISKVFSTPFVIKDTEVKLTVSIGIAFLDENAESAHRLFENAEQAMFLSKDNSRNSHAFYNKQLSEQASEREALKQALEAAIKNNDFIVHYQPIVSVKQQSVAKFEALVRWKLNGKWISPDEFIPIAEDFGLITDIGEIVLNKACQQLRLLNEQGFSDIVINVNRSIYEFPEVSAELCWLNTIYKYNLSPKNICFELTESVLAPENGGHIKLLNKLQRAGCNIALDDFGTGYSSLSYLRRFPINTLKIDRSFIAEMTKMEGDVALVSAIISMAKALDITVVAEGVEYKEELDILVELACDEIQGYYFSKPLSAELLTEFLTHFTFADN